MNKRQKKKYTDRVRSLVSEVNILTQEGKWHTDYYPEAIRLNVKMFRRCWNWAVKNDLFLLCEPAIRPLIPGLWYNIILVRRWNERPRAYNAAWGEKNA